MKLQTLQVTNDKITGFFLNGGYATATPVDLSSGPFAALPATLLSWLGGQLSTDEAISDVMLEQGCPVATAFTTSTESITDPVGNTVTFSTQAPTAWRDTLSAAVSVTAPLGQRTFAVSSESLPVDLRDGLLAAWQSLNS
jgi:hypothetical protein